MALVAIVRIGVVIEIHLDGRVLRRGLIELEKVFQRDIAALRHRLSGQEAELD